MKRTTKKFDFSDTICIERKSDGTVTVSKGFVQMSDADAKAYLAAEQIKGDAEEKARLAEKGHDCYAFSVFHDDEFRRGKRVSKHHWTCGKCNELLQVG